MNAQSCAYCSNLLAGRKNLRYCNYRGCQAKMCCANCQREHHAEHLPTEAEWQAEVAE